jgi:hypothetical protein
MPIHSIQHSEPMLTRQNTAKAHSALLESHGQFALTLLLSTLDSTSSSLAYPLGQLTLPSSILRPIPRKRHDLPPRQGEPAFQPQQEIFHTFKEDFKTVGYGKSVIGTGIVLAPWIVLLALVSHSPESRCYVQFTDRRSAMLAVVLSSSLHLSSARSLWLSWHCWKGGQFITG